MKSPQRLPVSPRGVHLRGHGDAKAAVRAAWHQLPVRRFVLKTDLKAYYESIDQERLQVQLAASVEGSRPA